MQSNKLNMSDVNVDFDLKSIDNSTKYCQKKKISDRIELERLVKIELPGGIKNQKQIRYYFETAGTRGGNEKSFLA